MSSTGHCNTARSLSAGVSNPKVFRGPPFFVWMNTTRMHLYTHVRPRGQSGMHNEYADGMIEHDGDVGKLLKTLDDVGIANDTIVLYATDNGPHMNSWPDAAMTPFRSEKDTNWEGAFRVPAMIRWPGHIFFGQKTPGTLDIWGEPFNARRLPLFFNLRWTRMNARRLRRTSTMRGRSIRPIWPMERKRLLRSSLLRSGIFRPDRSRRASISTRS